MRNSGETLQKTARAGRCDLHVHSQFSSAAGYWFLRALQAPESFTPPELAYEKARDRGMDFFTITDMNTIAGVEKISGLEGVFYGEEICSYVHTSRAPVHLLAYAFEPSAHDEICRLRESFEALAEFLEDRRIPFALAHPFYWPGAFTNEDFLHIVRRVPLVESLNGSRPARENACVAPLARAARGDQAFDGFIGGSDDRCGRFIGQTFTTVSGGATLESFIEGLRRGRCSAHGTSGGALKASYSVYSIAYSFYRERMLSQKLPSFATAAADRFFRPGSDREEPTLWHRADMEIHRLYSKAVSSSDPGPESLLLDELLSVGKDLWARNEGGENIDEKTFRVFSSAANRLIDRFGGLLLKRVQEGRLLDAFEAASALIPVLLLSVPFPVSYFHARKGMDAVRQLSSGFPGTPLPPGSGARAWFTDTIDDLNGVSRTLQQFSRLAVERSRRLAIVASQKRPLSFEGWVVNFPPIREFPVPQYESKLLSIPPFLDLLKFIDDNAFETIYISTPGPVGITALGCAKLLGIPAVGIYHTDFPRHAQQIVQDGHMGEFASTAMGWFYSTTDLVMVPSTYYMRELEKMGVPSSKMTIFPRGVDCASFSPEWRQDGFFRRFGGSGGVPAIVYVGRVSREKDLDILADAFLQLRSRGVQAELFIVGGGPYVEELSLRLSGRGGFFCGILRGDDLHRAYASADIFAFPSTTDTFGNVVLEASAAGIPSVVTDMGGPMEIVRDGVSGLVAHGRDVGSFADALAELVTDPARRGEMGRAARELALSRSWTKAFDAVWAAEPPAR